MKPILLFLLAFPFFVFAQQPNSQPLFSFLPPEQTGITFENTIVEKPKLNIMEIASFYNGGGVAVGDLNNDGLPDIFFTANMVSNKLYLNKGQFKFEDISKQAGIEGKRNAWKAGVTMADVNNDGWLDIYVCYGADVSEALRRNELFINNHNMTFTEKATEFGLDDVGYGTQATFFDYDRDGDLDMFLINQMVKNYQYFDVTYMKKAKDPLAGDKFFRNDGGKFTDISDAAGIIANPIGAGLSATVGDLNQDGWPDIYVCNDFDEDDYLYINQKDGTFKEELRTRVAHTSKSSMGSDVADFNNDGLLDIFSVDMLPEDNHRQKLLKGPEMYDFVAMLLSHGYHPQYMRNMLQLNNGGGVFSEIGQLAGISNTDWSWSPLFADFDLDGWKDLYITNGYLRDYTNLDFLKYTYGDARRRAQLAGQEMDLFSLVKEIPASGVKNYMYHNKGNLSFENMRQAWGFDQVSVSNGAIYADLDNDGDLDLVVNNINQKAFVYRNNAREQRKGNYLKLKFNGKDGNRFGIGARVTLTAADGRIFYQENIPSRGYQSSVEPNLLFGLGNLTALNLKVIWGDGSEQTLAQVRSNQTLTLNQTAASLPKTQAQSQVQAQTQARQAAPFFTEKPNAIDFIHAEDDFIDFKREPLLPHTLSQMGPALATADVNADGLEDVFIGGAKDQVSALYLQQPDGTFQEKSIQAFADDAFYEDVNALFFDADGDKDLDLYVVSGGNDIDADDKGNAESYQDRLYLNDGAGNFTKATLPSIQSCGGDVAAADFDGDGDLDLFRTGHSFAGKYPLAPRSYLLENRNGTLIDITPDALKEIGMATTATWADLDKNGKPELVLTGEWMAVRVFKIGADKSVNEITNEVGLGKTNGWWNRIVAVDIDGDGDLDLIGGNQGLNNQMRPSVAEPMTIVAGDFDDNGSIDPIISYYIQGKSYPIATRDELLDQIAPLRRFFTNYASYADATIQTFLSADQIDKALKLSVYTFESTIFLNNGKGVFTAKALPIEAQFAPIKAILAQDFNHDGKLDLLLAGNNFGERAQTGFQDAMHGLLLLGKGKGDFEAAKPSQTGLFIPQETCHFASVKTKAQSLIIAAINNAPVKVFEIK